MHSKMEEFLDVLFKQRAVIELWTAEKFPPIKIHRRMHAIYGDKCVDVSTVKADSHIACRAHAVPLPCRAAKGLECVFPIWFTQCGRVWFTLKWSEV